MEMDDSLTYAGVEREVAARRVRVRTELILRTLRQRILADEKLIHIPEKYTIECPCTVSTDEMPLVWAAIKKYGWSCYFSQGDMVFSKNDDPHLD